MWSIPNWQLQGNPLLLLCDWHCLLKMTRTFPFSVFHAFNISPVAVVMDSPVCEPQTYLACSTAFCKVKLKSVHCAVSLSNDIGHTSETLCISVCKWTLTLNFVPWLCGCCRNLSDIDQDGKLTAEEFILAMHLIDMAMSGLPLPPLLPPEFLPPTFRSESPPELNTSFYMFITKSDIIYIHVWEIKGFFNTVCIPLDKRYGLN